MKRLKPHPLAELLPRMSDAEFASLKADIATSKQKDAIVLLDGMILDGRNREQACFELKRKVKIRRFDSKTDGTPLQYVYSKAMHRHLNETQKACAAVNFLPHFEADAKARMKHDGSNKSAVELVPQAPISNGKSRDFAGSLFGVSGRYVGEAKRLHEESPKLFQRCFEGQMPLTVARREMVRDQKARDLNRKHHAASNGGSDDVSGLWRIDVGDCVELMPKMKPASARLMFTDPPYNEGFDYGRGAKADSLSDQDYLNWCAEWLHECVKLLTDDGSIFVMISSRYSGDIGVEMQSFGLHRRNTIVWHETFGNYTSGNFTSCWRAIHYYTKHPSKFVWHGDQILIPSDRQTKYADKRAAAGGKVPGNVWSEFPRLVDNAKERMPGFPTQIPLALAERIVLAASEPGDLVVDPFNGSGTTGAAAIKHHRRYVGIEEVKKNAEFARMRLSAAEREMRK